MAEQIIVRTDLALSNLDTPKITDNMLGSKDHRTIENYFDETPHSYRDRERGHINVLRSIATTVLYLHHPISRPYHHWKTQDLDFFRGISPQGTTIDHDFITKGELENDTPSPSYAYVPLIGEMAIRRTSCAEGNEFETVIVPGEGIVVADWLADYSVRIQPESIAIRMEFI